MNNSNWNRFSPAENLVSHKNINKTISNYIKSKAKFNEELSILEAGCGRKWELDLIGVNYFLTGVDIDKKALESRVNKLKDLNNAIVADLRYVSFDEDSFDIIYCENVLEHIDGAELVLKNFSIWLKPDGVIILIFPNRDSAQSYLTRITPFFIHIWYKKYLQGIRYAGKPGFDPYPVCFDKVISRKGIYEFCEKSELIIRNEYRMDGCPIINKKIYFFLKIILLAMHYLSFGKLSYDHRNLIYFIERSQKYK